MWDTPTNKNVKVVIQINRSKVCVERLKTQESHVIMAEKEGGRGSTSADFKTSRKAIAIETVWCWQKHRSVGLWNGRGSPGISHMSTVS